MVRIEVPKHDRLQHAKHLRRQVGTPHTTRTILVLTADDRAPKCPFRRVVVHRHFRTRQKHREPVPVVVQAAQDLLLGYGAGHMT
jgi:hypothetical protein